MSKLKSSVVFFGSGPVAAESLRLLAQNFEIEAIITKPTTEDEMSSACPDVAIYCVNTRSELDTLIDGRTFESKIGILIDFGIIVSRKVIDYFPFGIVNSHFSMLPEWRGADPISFAILSGQKKTGVSLMMIDVGMDTGKILVQKSVPIAEDETTASLTSKLITKSYELLIEYLPKYLSGDLNPRSQPHPDRATYSRKLTKENGVLDFTKTASQLEREIRAFIQWPKSRTQIAGKDVVIIEASVYESSNGKIGNVFKTEDKKIGIHTKSGSLIIEVLKPAGKNTMSAESFLAGYGDKLVES